MKRITTRAVSLLLLSAMVIAGLSVFVLRYIENGRSWALYFSRLNSQSSGQVLDRTGLELAAFDARENRFNDDTLTRTANYHVTGDYWGRNRTGVLSAFWGDLQGYSIVKGTTQAKHDSMELTVDALLDNKAYSAMGSHRGAVLVANYRTGEILCMVSTPAIDPMNPSENPDDGTYINRCLSAAFTPGSVFKLITAAAAIEQLPDIETRKFFCEGETTFAGVPVICVGAHYTQSFEQAMANSCNVAFSQIAVRLGQDTMIRYVRQYGFLDSQSLNGIPTAAGSFPLEFVGDPELGWAGIGQSTDLICPYSLLRYVMAIANDGILCEPTLLRSEKSIKSRFLEADTAKRLQELMANNVAVTYGGQAAFGDLPVCGKTGTAELGDETSHAWFTGFLNDEAHPYAFVVMVEQGGGGLSVAAPIASTILQYAVFTRSRYWFD